MDVVSHTSINKAHVSQHVMPVHILTQDLEFVKLVALTVSLVCHQLFVLHADQDLILRMVFVLLDKDVVIINSNTMAFVLTHALQEQSLQMDIVQEDVIQMCSGMMENVIMNVHPI